MEQNERSRPLKARALIKPEEMRKAGSGPWNARPSRPVLAAIRKAARQRDEQFPDWTKAARQ
jgi:hypothetical protein